MGDSHAVRRVRRLIQEAVDTALVPIHAAVSKPAQRAYLGTLLFTLASCILIAISSFAYVIFYYNFIPQIGVERVIHLQFGDGHPHGTASLSTSLVSAQPYDVSLYLHLPRTPSNIAAGNFMLDVSLFAPSARASVTSSKLDFVTGSLNSSLIARSRRPATLTYVSPLVDTASTLSGIPFYVLGWKTESEVLEVPVFESVEFSKGWMNVPRFLKVVVEADEKMQFYEVGVKITAKFGGLRWIIYNHPWFVLGSFFSDAKDKQPKKEEIEDSDKAIKSEEEYDDQFDPFSTEDLSDTSRSFPTLGRQMPLHFSSRGFNLMKGETEEEAKVKREEDKVMASTNIQPLGAEADDEDDEDDRGVRSWRDSGIGTSLEETDRRINTPRRRRSLFGSDK